MILEGIKSFINTTNSNFLIEEKRIAREKGFKLEFCLKMILF